MFTHKRDTIFTDQNSRTLSGSIELFHETLKIWWLSTLVCGTHVLEMRYLLPVTMNSFY